MIKKSNWRVNEAIHAQNLRVIGSDGSFIGILSRNEALAKAKELNTDIVEIAPKAEPPVAKIIDFGKFIYALEKKERQEKKKSKPAELKEVRLSPFIAEGDYRTRVRKIDSFLKNGHKVRVVVVFKGRHMVNQRRGYELMKEVLNALEQEVSIDMEPKFLGRHLGMVISPLKAKKADTKNAYVKPEKETSEPTV